MGLAAGKSVKKVDEKRLGGQPFYGKDKEIRRSLLCRQNRQNGRHSTASHGTNFRMRQQQQGRGPSPATKKKNYENRRETRQGKSEKMR